ncbi:MAG: hypothetical protein J7M08_06885 [Planctomycetes bacterium]|nr:hypothetical protein [Planctomycetota bacterium]
MVNDAAELARKLAQAQDHLRERLFEELQEHECDVETVFDPHSYSPLVHELREKYLTRLYLIQGVLQQLAHYGKGRGKPVTRVVSVAAGERSELVRRVNRKLAKLNGAKVLDVKFTPGGEEGWSALITYQLNPFVTEPDETAAWM